MRLEKLRNDELHILYLYPTLLEWPNEEDAVGEEREGEKKKALAYMGLVK
jgi:hypothetical protein